MICSGTYMRRTILWCQKRQDQAQHSCLAFTGRPYQSHNLMRISFYGSIGENSSTIMIGIAEIFHVQTDSFRLMMLFKAAYSRILTVVLLRHFHDIHQSSCRNSQ